jgi:hypothetical protein
MVGGAAAPPYCLGAGTPPPYQSKQPEQEIFRLFLFLRHRQIQD